MPIPIIVGLGVAAAAAYGAKKGYDGYQKKSESDDIVESAKSKYNINYREFQSQEKKTLAAMNSLGGLELDIGKDFQKFSILANSLLESLNKERQKKLDISFPKHKLQKIDAYTYSAISALGSIAGAGAAGAAAGFAVYGGVMTFAAASTGTAISSLAGAAATNATLAAIGGGSLAAGGLGIAGGTAILGAAVAAPILAIVGWAYDSHAEAALQNAHEAKRQSEQAVAKLFRATTSLRATEKTVDQLHAALTEIRGHFMRYLDVLVDIDNVIASNKRLGGNIDITTSFEDKIIQSVENGYALASILTDIISTPLFKIKQKDGAPVVDAEGVPQMETNEDGGMIINDKQMEDAIEDGMNAVINLQA